MRALIQRVKSASVRIDEKVHSSIGKGILILLGVRHDDGENEVAFVTDKCAALRIFDDPEGKMNLSVADVGGEALVVSQFTLYGDTKKGNRPSYSEAAPPESAEAMYKMFIARMKTALGEGKVQSGVFRATMSVELINDGPVTVLVESKPTV